MKRKWKRHFPWIISDKTELCISNSVDACNQHLAVKYLRAGASNVFPRKRKEATFESLEFQRILAGRQAVVQGCVRGGIVWSTVCAAVNDWVAWKISGSRSRCRAWPRCGYGCAGPGSWSWRMTCHSEDTCEVWPLCAIWSGSACQTYWGRSPRTSGTYRRRDMGMEEQVGWRSHTEKDPQETMMVREKQGDGGCWKGGGGGAMIHTKKL